MSKSAIENMLKEHGELQSYAWPGGYPIYYITRQHNCLCPKCANEEVVGWKDQLDRYWEESGEDQVDFCDINYEDRDLRCDECNARIESAYAEDDEEE